MNEQEEAKTRLKKQQQEIDHMKLRYLAAEEKQVNILPGKTVRQRFIVYSLGNYSPTSIFYQSLVE